MKIVIAGAGEMGSHLAKMLSGNGHDITIIDSDQKLLSDVGSLADVITVEGDSTTFAVLRKASVRKCDLFIAVNHEENEMCIRDRGGVFRLYVDRAMMLPYVKLLKDVLGGLGLDPSQMMGLDPAVILDDLFNATTELQIAVYLKKM